MLNSLKNAVYALYTLYAALLFVLLALLFFVPLVLLLPKLAWRRAAGSFTVKCFCVLTRLRVRTTGFDKLPNGACVAVANHCSYLDGPLLGTALPSRFSVVIKNEAENIPLVGFFLRRLDHILVERHNARRAAEDAQGIINRLANDQAIGIFAEGTFHNSPGVRRFKPSAFIGAYRHQAAVVPVAIAGTRQVLPGDRKTLRPGTIHITALPAVSVQTSDKSSERQQARDLAEQVRRQIAERIGEPLV